MPTLSQGQSPEEGQASVVLTSSLYLAILLEENTVEVMGSRRRGSLSKEQIQLGITPPASSGPIAQSSNPGFICS